MKLESIMGVMMGKNETAIRNVMIVMGWSLQYDVCTPSWSGRLVTSMPSARST